MTDYSKMSDQHINQLVGIAISRDNTSIIASDGNAVIHEYADCGELKGLCLGWKVFDPCNNPADAWPIIFDNKITIMHDGGFGDRAPEWSACSSFYINDRGVADYFNLTDATNPLRAAMIVFLMMQEK